MKCNTTTGRRFLRGPRRPTSDQPEELKRQVGPRQDRVLPSLGEDQEREGPPLVRGVHAGAALPRMRGEPVLGAGAVGRGAVAELTGVVLAPADRLAGKGGSAGMPSPSR